MSFSQDGPRMDRTLGIAGSVRRARGQAPVGLPRAPSDVIPSGNDEGTWPSRRTQPTLPGPLPSRIPVPSYSEPDVLPQEATTVSISRPTQIPQWPLRGPVPTNNPTLGSQSFQIQSQPPPRPQRPSNVPSILDASRIQDPIPSGFSSQQLTLRDSTNELLSVPPGPETPSSRPSTLSSVGSIPDFPIPVAVPLGPPRRSVTLGPPPSARRGASSFYSNASFVSPIPEESPKTKSHGSFASSAAMPEGWNTDSPGYSPASPETFFDERVRNSSRYSGSEFGDESQLVENANVEQRIPSITMSAPNDQRISIQRPSPSPIQLNVFSNGTGYLEASSSSSGALPTKKTRVSGGLTVDGTLGAVEAASSSDPNVSRKLTPSPRGFSRLSAIRRPPKLDIDVIRDAEARGSLTSLPDLIRRATRLAAMIEKGKRPASNLDADDFPEDIYGPGWDPEKDCSLYEKHQSGLSDMLAAFPPPAQAGESNRRAAWRQNLRNSTNAGWPLPFARSQSSPNDPSIAIGGLPSSSPTNINTITNRQSSYNSSITRNSDNMVPPASSRQENNSRRKCCGLPVWGFLIVVAIILILIAAAVIIPLQIFVFQNQDSNSSQSALSECETQLECLNGGTNVVSQNICSCICTNGFTGSDCSIPGSDGCTTATITGSDSNISNVTLGQAIPRLIASAQTNFSLALSAQAILAKLNTGNLSCEAQNALVTFDGRSTRGIEGQSGEMITLTDPVEDTLVAVANQLVTVTLQPGGSSTITISTTVTGISYSTIITAADRSTVFATTITFGAAQPAGTTTTTVTATPTSSTTSSVVTPTPSASFIASDTVFDFARVAVLFILQEETLDDASFAQSNLQEFFSDVASPGVSIAQATNVTIGGDKSVDLVNFQVNIGDEIAS